VNTCARGEGKKRQVNTCARGEGKTVPVSYTTPPCSFIAKSGKSVVGDRRQRKSTLKGKDKCQFTIVLRCA
jgi:hypothetical protein